MNTEVDNQQKRAVKIPEYNALVNSATLQEIRLVESQFSMAPESIADPKLWKLMQSCEITESHYDADDKVLFAWVSAQASCTYKRKRVVSAKCEYLVIYNVDGDPEDVEVDIFAKRVARFAAYPYFRAHFAEVTSQAGLTLAPLPIIKEKKYFPPKKKEPQLIEGSAEQPKEEGGDA
jgi:hypothetical protein